MGNPLPTSGIAEEVCALILNTRILLRLGVTTYAVEPSCDTINCEAVKSPRPRLKVVRLSVTLGAQPVGVVETLIIPIAGGINARTPVASGKVFKKVGTGDTLTVSAWPLSQVLSTVTPDGFPPAK